MPRTITVPDELYSRLEALARPFVDKEPADVIQRLIDVQGEEERSDRCTPLELSPLMASTLVDERVPRERGAIVNIDGHVIHADSVRDLYEQILQYLARHKTWDRVVQLVPYKTSSRRFLIAQSPVHPNGNPFVVPVEHHGLYMESHKNYQTAITQLARFLSKCGSTLTYLGA
jgi:hypothetical protein